MESKPKIIYDGTCVICRTYMRLVQNKVSADQADFLPTNGTAGDFEYVAKDGKRYAGTKAIEAMSSDFPAIKEYMYALPEKYKTFGLKVGYKIGSVVRKVLGKVNKGCNCGKH